MNSNERTQRTQRTQRGNVVCKWPSHLTLTGHAAYYLDSCVKCQGGDVKRRTSYREMSHLRESTPIMISPILLILKSRSMDWELSRFALVLKKNKIIHISKNRD